MKPLVTSITRTSYEVMALFQELNQHREKRSYLLRMNLIYAAFSSRTITLKDGKVVKDNKNPQVRSAREMLACITGSSGLLIDMNYNETI